ncbi:carbohydrate ABC transporter permease [Cellulomonas endophytica]|uniref:carbohydrate ABC transporter permease n=1 Tax=Cellulomonas endophytica TaxID=2494735 RepID=UPI00101359F3|nr:sugar ABC transporter permease [Cellulomonas endophytica]
MSTTTTAVTPAPRGVSRSTGGRRQRALQLAFIVPAGTYLALFFGYPVIQNLLMGFQEYTTATFFTGEAPWVGLDNYRAVLTSEIFRRAAVNTVVFTFLSIAGQFVLGMALAVFFRRRFPLNNVLRSLLLLPWLIPLIVSSAIWRWMLDKDSGVVNQMIGAISASNADVGWLTDTSIAMAALVGVNIWLGIPFALTILYSGLQDIPQELYEAGALDGATGRRAFRHITWPLLRPVVTVVLVLGVVYTLKALDIILGLTGGGPANATQTLATEAYRLSFVQFDFGQGAAVGNLLIVVSLLFAVIYLRANRRAIDE